MPSAIVVERRETAMGGNINGNSKDLIMVASRLHLFVSKDVNVLSFI